MMRNLEKKSPTAIGQFKQSDNTIAQSNNGFDNNSNDVLTLEDNYCTKNAQESWLENTVQMAIKQGHRPIPMVDDDKGIHPKAYGEYQRYSLDHPMWKKALTDIVAIAMDDFILVDYDGNKPKGAIPLAELFDIIGDEPNLVQTNDDEDSLHFLYRIPSNIDKATLKHSNDNWMHGVDIKTMNQPMYLKRHKTIIDSELPTLEEVDDAPQAIIDALTKVTSENLKARSESKAGKLKAAEIISHIDPDCEYDEWRNVGMGLHNEFKGDPLGLQIWDNWSATGSGYSGFTDLEYKYKSFTGDKGITFGSVCMIAKNNGADLSEIAKKYDENGELKPTFNEMMQQAEQLTPEYDEADINSLLKYCQSLTAIQTEKLLATIKKTTEISLGTLKVTIKENASENDELDQLDLAKHVVDGVGRENIIAAQSFVWLWGNTGVWRKQEERSVRQIVQCAVPPLVDVVAKHLIDGVTDLLKTEVYRPDHEFNIGESESVNCLNGELSLYEKSSEWLLEPHNRENYRTTQIPIKYDNEAKAPRFSEFMGEVFKGDDDAQDKIKALLEMIGYSLMAHCRHEKFTILVGSGANGKSVLLSVLEAVCGYVNVAGVQPSQFDNKFQRAHLFGKLTNIVTEIEQGQVIADAALKGIVSGEPTTVEHKFKDPFMMRPFSTCWFGTNHMPQTRDFSDALYRRVLIVSFNNTFKPEFGNCDPMLKDKLIDELPGILNLALDAYANAIVNGFTMPISSEQARKEWCMQSDQVTQFVEECGKKDPNSKETMSDVFESYQSWTLVNGISTILGKKSLRDRLTRLGFGNKRDSKERYVTGLKLYTPDTT